MLQIKVHLYFKIGCKFYSRLILSKDINNIQGSFCVDYINPSFNLNYNVNYLQLNKILSPLFNYVLFSEAFVCLGCFSFI